MKIAFTGGGTIGHVAVNMALIPEARKKNIECIYIGSKNGIEKEMMTSSFEDVPYFSISSGKLRRYISLENMKDVFKVQKGILDAYKILKRERPTIVFSKGGFVTVPVLIAAKLLKIPTIIHESDVTPGLANKIGIKFANKIYTTFLETVKYLPKDKADYVGSIIRLDLLDGDTTKGYALTGLNNSKPVLMIMGGSLGSKYINQLIFDNIDTLLDHYQIIHITGPNNETSLERIGYKQFSFVKEELPHLYAITQTIVSRAGANAIYEFLALKIPALLIPLGLDQSRGDQIDNAKIFEQRGFANVLHEEQLSIESLMQQLSVIELRRDDMISKMEQNKTIFTPETVLNKILKDAGAKHV